MQLALHSLLVVGNKMFWCGHRDRPADDKAAKTSLWKQHAVKGSNHEVHDWQMPKGLLTRTLYSLLSLKTLVLALLSIAALVIREHTETLSFLPPAGWAGQVVCTAYNFYSHVSMSSFLFAPSASSREYIKNRKSCSLCYFAKVPLVENVFKITNVAYNSSHGFSSRFALTEVRWRNRINQSRPVGICQSYIVHQIRKQLRTALGQNVRTKVGLEKAITLLSILISKCQAFNGLVKGPLWSPNQAQIRKHRQL